MKIDYIKTYGAAMYYDPDMDFVEKYNMGNLGMIVYLFLKKKTVK